MMLLMFFNMIAFQSKSKKKCQNEKNDENEYYPAEAPSENKTKNEQNVGRFLQQTKTEIRTTVCFDIKAKIAKWFTKSHHSVMSIFQNFCSITHRKQFCWDIDFLTTRLFYK